MSEFYFNLTIYGKISAPTLESAQQKLDNAIDFSELRRREINVEGVRENIENCTNSRTEESVASVI